MTKQIFFIIFGAVFGLLSVMMGAMADHALDITADQIQSLNTAIRYGMIYAMFIVALSLNTSPIKTMGAAMIFAMGVTLFTGGICLSIFTDIPYIVYITPVGGVILMMGWVAIGVQAIRFSLKSKKTRNI